MGASTIVVAREDLSIPGAADADNGAACSAADVEARFFNVVRQHNPDVVVLDLTGSQGNGIADNPQDPAPDRRADPGRVRGQ